MEQKLCEAAIDGDVDSLTEILQKDRLILDRAAAGFSTINPLHIAASHGQTTFVKKLMETHGRLTRVLDCQNQSALHVASANGHVDVVKELIAKRPEMCRACDKDGRNPLHVAATEGKTEVLRVLFERKPRVARDRVNGGDTILHLCVKYDQTESLRLLLKLDEGSEFVNAQDRSGNTVLHLAVSDKHVQMVRYLLDKDNNIKIDVNATNATGQTALDILILSKTRKESKDSEVIEDYLRRAGAKNGHIDPVKREWLDSKRNVIMVVASLIATMAFQAGVNPPGGVWQENSSQHKAGEAIMAYNYPDSYHQFLRANTIGFVASLSTIILLLSSLPLRKRAYMVGLVVTMWVTITSMAFTYTFSTTVLTPKKNRGPLSSSIVVGFIVWWTLMAVILMVHSLNLIKSEVEDRQEKFKAVKNIVRTKTAGCFTKWLVRIGSVGGANSSV